MKIKSLDEIRHLLDLPLQECYEEIEEDLLIEQPDGSRACISYEIAWRGFHICFDGKKEVWYGDRETNRRKYR